MLTNEKGEEDDNTEGKKDKLEGGMGLKLKSKRDGSKDKEETLDSKEEEHKDKIKGKKAQLGGKGIKLKGKKDKSEDKEGVLEADDNKLEDRKDELKDKEHKLDDNESEANDTDNKTEDKGDTLKGKAFAFKGKRAKSEDKDEMLPTKEKEDNGLRSKKAKLVVAAKKKKTKGNSEDKDDQLEENVDKDQDEPGNELVDDISSDNAPTVKRSLSDRVKSMFKRKKKGNEQLGVSLTITESKSITHDPVCEESIDAVESREGTQNDIILQDNFEIPDHLIDAEANGIQLSLRRDDIQETEPLISDDEETKQEVLNGEQGEGPVIQDTGFKSTGKTIQSEVSFTSDPWFTTAGSTESNQGFTETTFDFRDVSKQGFTETTFDFKESNCDFIPEDSNFGVRQRSGMRIRAYSDEDVQDFMKGLDVSAKKKVSKGEDHEQKASQSKKQKVSQSEEQKVSHPTPS